MNFSSGKSNVAACSANGDKLASAVADGRQKIASVIAAADVFQRGAARLRLNPTRPFFRHSASAPPRRRRRSRLVVAGGIATLMVSGVVCVVCLGTLLFPALSRDAVGTAALP